VNITAKQVKAARGLLGWSVIKLAVKSNVGKFVIDGFEHGTGAPQSTTIAQLRAAFEAEGVTFGETGKPSIQGGRSSESS
jgi:ribosome-binding protein aMBF1 (putative translation factor)